MTGMNYDIPEQLYRDFKILAVKQGLTVKALLIQVMQDAVDTDNEGKEQ